jgi:hypothetical protein
MTAEGLRAALAAYDPADASEIADRLRAEATAENYAAAYVDLYTAALAAPEPAHDAMHAATAAWLEELLPTSAQRAWRSVAREISDYTTAPLENALDAFEERLVATIHQASATQDAMRHQAFAKQEATLATGITRLVAHEDASLQTHLAAQRSLLQDLEARFEAKLEAAFEDGQGNAETALAVKLSELPGPRLERLLRALWRRALPPAIRGPLHKWRRALLKRL